MITEIVLMAMARSLNLKEDSLLKQYGERAIMHTRFNFHPRCPRPDLVLGLKPHSDASAITVLKSPVHRVLTNSERERTTVAVFCTPDSENEIEPVEELVSEQSPRLYNKVNLNYYVSSSSFQYYQQWNRPLIDALKI